MTDKKPQSPAPLTDKQRVTQQVGITDVTTGAAQALSGMFPFGGRVRFFGKTDFEGHRLNEMIDLIHPANPQHLISAGDALFAAHEAISSAAAELRGHIGKVEWEGESGEAFRTWGNNLANHANRLAEFADTAGVQISAAGQGLVSVKSAMPPRDHRAEPVKVDDLPTAKRVAGNAEYEAALKVEQDRQEAINQMNRLSSFYSVSEQTLAAQEPPVFEPMPKVGVPQPLPGWERTPTPPAVGMPGHQSGVAVATSHTPAGGAPPVRTHLESLAGSHHSQGAVGAPPVVPVERPVGTELNGVAVLPTPTPTFPPGPAPSQAPPSRTLPVTSMGPGGSPVAPFANGNVKPSVGGSARAFGAAKRLGSPARPPATSAETPGRASANSWGRAGAAAASDAREGTSGVGQSPVGRGVAGGSPRVGNTGPAGSGAGTSGRGSGIAGGRPAGTPASRPSKGNVVGGEGATGTGRPTSSPGQRGVISTPKLTSTGGPQGNGYRPDSRDGVLGTPSGRISGSRRTKKGFTSGGTGLVRSHQDHGGPESDEEEVWQAPGNLFEGERPQQSDAPPATN
ncbi:WXG100 family type VII secretion target [Streptomyces sp. MBT27]|uniref:WXG100 family type VII secretion target n=1 Tax=Streptomyces sp. MBT27 TaxID=1488356 RepID=UPI0014229A37|nr:WXG100 family type VII secretion target [Streptomyces sp. MBT27]